jgi:hypothetical protein
MGLKVYIEDTKIYIKLNGTAVYRTVCTVVLESAVSNSLLLNFYINYIICIWALVCTYNTSGIIYKYLEK